MRNKKLNQYVEGKNKNNVFFVYVKFSASESLTDAMFATVGNIGRKQNLISFSGHFVNCDCNVTGLIEWAALVFEISLVCCSRRNLGPNVGFAYYPRLTIMANSWIFIHDSSMIHGSPCHESFHDLGKISMIHGWFMDGNPWFMDGNPWFMD